MLKKIINILKKNKKYWIIPSILTILLILLIIILGSNGNVSPFIYAIF